jgi:hypothetical protein
MSIFKHLAKKEEISEDDWPTYNLKKVISSQISIVDAKFSKSQSASPIPWPGQTRQILIVGLVGIVG